MKVLITPRSFGKNSDEAFRRLEEGGFEIIRKADGSIYTEEEMKAAVEDADAVIVAAGPLASDALAETIRKLTGEAGLSFYDAAAPIITIWASDRIP